MPELAQTNGAQLYYNVDTYNWEQHIIYIGTDGSLNEAWYDTHKWDSRPVPGSPASNPVAASITGPVMPELDVFYRDTQSRVHRSFWALADTEGNKAWFDEPLEGGPASNVSHSADMNLYYVEFDGHLHYTWLLYGGGAKEILGNPIDKSSPLFGVTAQQVTRTLSKGKTVEEDHIFYVSANGVLAQTWFSPGNIPDFLTQELPGVPQGVPAAIEQYVFYAANGAPGHYEIHESWWNGGGWSGPAPLPGVITSDSRLLVYTYQPTKAPPEQHVFFIDENGTLAQAWWDWKSWKTQPLKGSPTRLLGVLNDFDHDVGGNYFDTEQHVFFRGTDGQLHQSWWNGIDWQTQMIPTHVQPAA